MPLRPGLASVIAFVGWAVAGCTSLPDVAPNQCGNGVVEPEIGEHCDGAAVEKGPNGEDTVCGAPGVAGACRYVPTAEGVCPVGYRATTDGVCRKPSGNFVELASIDGSAARLVPIDLGGDGKTEIGIAGAVSIGFFDFGDGQARDLFTLPTLIPSDVAPVVADVSGDGVDDLVLPSLDAFSTYVGQSDGTLDPLLYSNIQQIGLDFRAFNAEITPLSKDIQVLIGVEQNAEGRVSVGLAGFGGGVGDVADPSAPFTRFALGHVDVEGNACAEIVFHDFSATDAMGKRSIRVTNTCPCLPACSGPNPPETCQENCIPTDPPRPSRAARTVPGVGATIVRPPSGGSDGQAATPPSIESGFHEIDVDHDGILDLVVQAETGAGGACASSLYLLHGGGIDEDFVPIDTSLLRDGPLQPALRCGSHVRAVGFFDRDDLLDAVVDEALYTTKIGKSFEVGDGPVVMDDLNGDGATDLVIAGIFSGIIVVAGGVDIGLPGFYETQGEVRFLGAADLDGDKVRDLVLGEVDVSGVRECGVESEAEVLFGRRDALPETPTYVGSLPNLVQLYAEVLTLGELDAFGDAAFISQCDGQTSGALVEGNATRVTVSEFRLPQPDLVEKSAKLAGLSVGDVFSASGNVPDGIPDVIAYATIGRGPRNEQASIDNIAVWLMPGTGGGGLLSVPPIQAEVSYFDETRGLKGTASSIVSTLGGQTPRMFVWFSGRRCDDGVCNGTWETFYADPAATSGEAVVPLGHGDPPAIDQVQTGTPLIEEVVLSAGAPAELLVRDPSWGVYRIHDVGGSLAVDALDPLVAAAESQGKAPPLVAFAVVDAGEPRTLVLNERALYRFDPEPNTMEQVANAEKTFGGRGLHLVAGDFDGDGLEDVAVATTTRIQILRQLSEDETSSSVVLSINPKK